MKMAKTKRRRRGKGGFTVPVAVVAGFTPLAVGAYRDQKEYGWQGMLSGICARTTGYNPQVQTWSFGTLMQGMGPILAGVLVHKVVGQKMGVNRFLGKSGIPFIRL